VKKINVAINASRARSGGAISHINGILKNFNINEFNIKELHVWGYSSLINNIESSEIVTHSHKFLDKSLPFQIYWELFMFKDELIKNKIDILLNLDAGTLCSFTPSITMSRDMLSYEPGEMERFKWGFQRLRLLLIKYSQNRSLRNSYASIFLTKYASEVIQKSTGKIKNFTYIPHGVSNNFRRKINHSIFAKDKNSEYNCLYVSNLSLYKHQWNVIEAIKSLRDEGLNVKLTLTCGAATDKLSEELLAKSLEENCKNDNFVKITGFINQNEIPNLMSNCDIFIFASSCENMPNTLIEGMSFGLPIACSNRGPMPEVLKDGGLYFDPENVNSISESVKKIILDKELRKNITLKSNKLSMNFSWKKCSNQTFNYITEIYKKYINE